MNQNNQKNNKNVKKNIKDQLELSRSYSVSAKLASQQIFRMQSQINEKNQLIQSYQNSTSWKITAPLRIFFSLLNGDIKKKYPLNIVKRRIAEVYRKEGYKGVYDRVKYHTPFLRFQLLRGKKKQNQVILQAVVKPPHDADSLVNKESIYQCNFAQPVIDIANPTLLIIAEVTLPQCYKYRVQQKAEHLERLGWIVKIVDWRDQKSAISALQVCHDVIFYRVPAFPNVVEQISEAKRLGLNPWWEVDDLIVDIDRYAECGFMEDLSKEEKDLLFFGADLFRKTMLLCGRAIASTNALAGVMQQAGLPDVYVIENALDHDTLRIANLIALRKKETSYLYQTERSEIVIVYGSGTNTHNADFQIASGGILAALKSEPRLRLSIVGELELSIDFQEVAHQIRYTPPQTYEQYLEILSQADIAIAPLEPILFNDCKSNIKYLEASILKVASVCSARQAFKKVIIDSQNGFLAETTQEWCDKLLLLARNESLRHQMGQQAYKDVSEYYKPEAITENQVKPIFGQYPQAKKISKKLKILVVNVYYDPNSFGGATLVAEEMARQTHGKNNVEVTVFTTRPIKGAERGLHKYRSQDNIVYSLDLPPLVHETQQFDNVVILEPFESVLTFVKPDIVHFHAVQNMGLQMLMTCQSKHIPYVITLHDSWWLCNRQFMVRSNGQYCFQKKIDLRICQSCEAHAQYLTERMLMMKQALNASALLLSPSEIHRQLFIENGIEPAQIKVNRNGVSRPQSKRPMRDRDAPIRFGFVAGDEVIKGALVIQKVFKSLKRSDWELKIIDSKVEMGFPPIDVDSWRVKGKVITIPPYSNAGKDDFFYGIDVLLFPSQWKESYGMTVREALLRDVWVICSYPGGQSEDVIDGVNGNYVSLTGDVDELQAVVEALLDNVSLFDNYHNPHKDHIATIEGQAEELSAYYHNIHVLNANNDILNS